MASKAKKPTKAKKAKKPRVDRSWKNLWLGRPAPDEPETLDASAFTATEAEAPAASGSATKEEASKPAKLTLFQHMSRRVQLADTVRTRVDKLLKGRNFTEAPIRAAVTVEISKWLTGQVSSGSISEDDARYACDVAAEYLTITLVARATLRGDVKSSVRRWIEAGEGSALGPGTNGKAAAAKSADAKPAVTPAPKAAKASPKPAAAQVVKPAAPAVKTAEQTEASSDPDDDFFNELAADPSGGTGSAAADGDAPTGELTPADLAPARAAAAKAEVGSEEVGELELEIGDLDLVEVKSPGAVIDDELGLAPLDDGSKG